MLESSAEKAEAVDFLNAVYAKDVDFYQTILQDRGAVDSLLAARGEAAMARPMPSSAVKRSGRTFPTGSRRFPRSPSASSPTRRIPPSPRNCGAAAGTPVRRRAEGDRLRGQRTGSSNRYGDCLHHNCIIPQVEVDLREKLCSNSKCYSVLARLEDAAL